MGGPRKGFVGGTSAKMKSRSPGAFEQNAATVQMVAQLGLDAAL